MEESLYLLKNPFELLKFHLQRLGRVHRSRLAIDLTSSKTSLLGPAFPSNSILNDPRTPQDNNTKPQRSSSHALSMKEPIKDYSQKLKSIFERLYNQYVETDWVRNFNNKKYLHIVIVRQLWLDSYLYLHIMHAKLLAPIKNKTWIDFNDFVRSMEGIHIRQSIYFLFISISSSSKLKIAKRIQKMLFYFNISSDGKKKLPYEKILKVLLLARRRKSTWTLANSTLRPIIEQDRATHSCNEIHFEDFKNIIASIDN